MYNILIIGSTGVGKSTLLNKIKNKDVANIGYGVKPETQTVERYNLTSKITLWDSPGLGEAIEKDQSYEKRLKKILKDEGFINLILIVIDIKDKRITTVSKLIKKIMKVNKNFADKFVFILNKVDEAKNYRYWDDGNNCPSPIQLEEIQEKIKDYTKRIEEKTHIQINKFLSCSAETGYNLHTISNSLYSCVLENHYKER